MNGWNYRRWLFVSAVLAGLIWGVVFLFSTKPVQLWVLRRAVGVENLSFERGQLSWGAVYVENLELETAGIRLQAREAKASFSSWKALFGKRDAIGDLELSEARLLDVDPTKQPWPGRVLATLGKWRPRKDLLHFNSLSLQGIWEGIDGAEASLDLKGKAVDFSNQGKLDFVFGPPPEDHRKTSFGVIAGTLTWSRAGGSLLVGADGNATLATSIGTSLGINRFSSNLRLSDDGQFLDGKWIDGDRTVLKAEFSRASAESPFSGGVELAMHQGDWATIWMGINAFKVRSTAKISAQWRPETGSGACDFRMDGNASSFWFRQLGLLSLGVEGSIQFDLEGIDLLGLQLKATTGRGETVSIAQSGEVRLPELLGSSAKVSFKTRGLRLDWLTPWVPLNREYGWRLSDLSVHAESEGDSWRASVPPFALLRGDIPMVKINKLLAVMDEANGTARTVELEFDSAVTRGWLAEFLPKNGPLSVFDADDGSGGATARISFSSDEMILRGAEIALSAGGGARRLHLEVQDEVRLDPSQPDFLEPTVRGDLFSVEGSRLPIDGLIRWRGGAEFQGDAEVFSGKLSRDDGGWTFRSEGEVEIGNARMVHNEVIYGEGLRVRTVLEVHQDQAGSLHLNAEDLLLEGEGKTSLEGNLTLVAKPGDQEEFSTTSIESSGLKVDLTTLSWLGFSEFPDLQSGFFKVGKLKILFGDEWSFEVDGALDDFRVLNEVSMKGGLQATARRQLDGFSTWARLSLIRQNRESDVTLDVFLPNDGNASRRKHSLSGEQAHLGELLSFVATIPGSTDREGLLEGKRFPDWARGSWDISFDTLQITGIPPFSKPKAKLHVRSRELLLANAQANWLSGLLSGDGALTLGHSVAPRMRLEKLNAKAENLWVEDLTHRAKGRLDAQLNGWSKGMGWGELHRAFTGKIMVTAKDGSLRLGPLPKGEDNALPAPWSLVRLSQLLEGKVSTSDVKKGLLGALDSALETVGFDFAQLIAQRSSDGNYSVTELSARGPVFHVFGEGKLLPHPRENEGRPLNLNLSVGVRGEAARTFEALGLLAPIKAEGEYRMLKKVPLVVQGTLNKPDFSNFWALLAEGLGLGTFDFSTPR